MYEKIIKDLEQKYNKPSGVMGKVVGMDSNTGSLTVQCFGKVHSLINVPYMCVGVPVTVGDYVTVFLPDNDSNQAVIFGV